MNYKFVFFLVFYIISLSSYSQNFFNQDILVFDRETKLEKANSSFNLEKYGEAYALFKEIYRKEKNKDLKMELNFKMAECLRLTNSYNNLRKAEQIYNTLIRQKYTIIEEGYIVYYNLGLVLQMQGKYKDAIKVFEKYSELVPINTLSQIKLESCKYAINNDNFTRYEIERFNMINSRDFDYSPSYNGNDYSTLYFTSNRKNDIIKGNDASLSIGGGSSTTFDIWSIKKLNKGWSKPTLFTPTVNSGDHEATATTTIDGKMIYFTKCSMPSKYNQSEDKKPYCRIYFTEEKDKGWTSPVLLPLPYDSIANFGHPSVSKDGKKIFFSSDMRGGYGGNDIWFIQKIKRDEWGYPINLGPNINTSGDEIYPFLHQNQKELYFSSNGHVECFGGHDIFKSEWDTDGNLLSVHNMKKPINSSMNDYSIIFESNSEKGFLSTDRKETQNGDIYFVKLKPIILTVSGVVIEEGENTFVTKAMVKILGTNNSSDSILTDNFGHYEFGKDILLPGNSYSISVKKDGYENKSAEFSTIGITDSEDIELDFAIVNVQQDLYDLNEPSNNIAFFDFNSSELRPDALKELDLWAEYILKYDGLVFQVNAYADFRASDKYNIELSEARAKSCKDYLVNNKGITEERILVYAKGEQEPFVMDYNVGKFKKGDVLSEEYINKLRKESLIEKAHQYNRRAKIIWLEDKRYDKLRGGIVDY